jgi:hypothetical protein
MITKGLSRLLAQKWQICSMGMMTLMLCVNWVLPETFSTYLDKVEQDDFKQHNEQNGIVSPLEPFQQALLEQC